ncbi:UDP-glycosyltransferase 71K2-like [Neltuma alba]|uniref:UDP-glycosyltransferase 71K2-like n=1 Tax=Neltuma alba TaxID=207710 RepID=UPI0010A2EB7B|nr:UDP-glycosyltransferase 71K2-like [Prosopis alba]
MKNSELIFIPSPGIGHLVSALEFAKRVIDYDSRISFTILCIKFPFTAFSNSYIKSVLASQPRIRLIDLPEVDPPPPEPLKPPVYLIYVFTERLIPHKRQIDDEFKDSGPELLIPGFSNLVPPKYAIDDILKDEKVPPIYTVGPLIELKGQPNSNLDQAQHVKTMKWLDDQPPSSVVFLCFGSMGILSPSQTRELAEGLKNSGVRFLWAMRSPPTKDHADRTLTEGFLESTHDNGMICGWAPQVGVLAHKSIVGFVSHCGWNSIMESLWFGVPILRWPIYAEQQLNAFRMVREFGLAVELILDYRSDGDLVLADEIERGITQLTDRDSEVRKKVQEMKEKARKAVSSGGSSFISTGRLIEDIIDRNI